MWDKTIDGFMHDILQHRKELNTSWIDAFEKEVAGVANMNATEANRLLTQMTARRPDNRLACGEIQRAVSTSAQDIPTDYYRTGITKGSRL